MPELPRKLMIASFLKNPLDTFPPNGKKGKKGNYFPLLPASQMAMPLKKSFTKRSMPNLHHPLNSLTHTTPSLLPYLLGSKKLSKSINDSLTPSSYSLVTGWILLYLSLLKIRMLQKKSDY